MGNSGSIRHCRNAAATSDVHTALENLQQAEQMERQARCVAVYKGADLQFFLWGGIWLVGFVAQHFFHGEMIRLGGQVTVAAAGLIWWPLALIGVLAGMLLVRRCNAVWSENGRRIGMMWGAVSGYAMVVSLMIAPFLSRGSGRDPEMVMTALACTFPMFAYIMMGLMGYGAYLGWLGAGIIGITLIGYLFAAPWFYLWMAVFGAGGLLATGVIIRRRLRKNESA